jgi:preprotein translocase subunit SecD
VARGKQALATAAAALAAVALLSACSSDDDVPPGSMHVELHEVFAAVGTPGCGDDDVAAIEEDSNAQTGACNRTGDTLFTLGPSMTDGAFVQGFGLDGAGDDVTASIAFDQQTAEQIRILTTREGASKTLAVVIDGEVMSHARTPDGLTDGQVEIPALTQQQADDLEKAVMPTAPPPPPPTESLTLTATTSPTTAPDTRLDGGAPITLEPGETLAPQVTRSTLVEVRRVITEDFPEACDFPSDVVPGEEARELLACAEDGVTGYRLGFDELDGGDVRSAEARDGGADVGWLVDVQLDDRGTRALARSTQQIGIDSDLGRLVLVVNGQVVNVPALDDPVTDGRLTLTPTSSTDGPPTVYDAAFFVDYLTATTSPGDFPDPPSTPIEWLP